MICAAPAEDGMFMMPDASTPALSNGQRLRDDDGSQLPRPISRATAIGQAMPLMLSNIAIEALKASRAMLYGGRHSAI